MCSPPFRMEGDGLVNTGKIFEQNFKKSVPDDFYYLRLKDPAVGWTGGASKYSPTNPFDCLIYTGTGLHCIELKSTARAITFWRADFENDGKKHTFEIKKHQIQGLNAADIFAGVYPSIVINFRDVDETWCITITDFLILTGGTSKKSINHEDASLVGYRVPSRKLKVNERYDIKAMTEAIEHGRR